MSTSKKHGHRRISRCPYWRFVRYQYVTNLDASTSIHLSNIVHCNYIDVGDRLHCDELVEI